MSTLSSQQTIVAKDLTPRGFALFGDVMSSTGIMDQLQSQSANYGTATKLRDVSRVTNLYDYCPSRKPGIASWHMFQCTPPEHMINDNTYLSKVLERHSFSSQTFVPMGRSKHEVAYLVIVAPTGVDGLPHLEGVAAFKCYGGQAVTYAAGTWHAPMIALGEVTDFAVFVHENKEPNEDCEEAFLNQLKVKF